MDQNKSYAYLCVVGFWCTVDELTRRIGLQPTEAWHAGDAAPPPKPQRKFNAWHLRSRLETDAAVEKHVIDVLDQIRGREPVLCEIAREFGITMECVGYFYEYNPGFSLDADTIRRLAECGAGIDLDFFTCIQINRTPIEAV